MAVRSPTFPHLFDKVNHWLFAIFVAQTRFSDYIYIYSKHTHIVASTHTHKVTQRILALTLRLLASASQTFSSPLLPVVCCCFATLACDRSECFGLPEKENSSPPSQPPNPPPADTDRRDVRCACLYVCSVVWRRVLHIGKHQPLLRRARPIVANNVSRPHDTTPTRSAICGSHKFEPAKCACGAARRTLLDTCFIFSANN